MNGRNIFVFVEGKTEERLLKQIARLKTGNIVPCKGKNNIPAKLARILDDEIGKQPLGIFILRDRDREEEYSHIVQSFEDTINNFLQRVNVPEHRFQSDAQFPHLFLMDVSQVNWRIALHIAAPPSLPGMEFVSDTIDGYILALALREKIRERFANDTGTTGEVLRAKVLEEVPYLAKQNDIIFNQAKDLLGIYMAMSRFITTKRSEEEDLFSGIVVSRAKKYDNEAFQEVFSSLLTALRFLEVDI